MKLKSVIQIIISSVIMVFSNSSFSDVQIPSCPQCNIIIISLTSLRKQNMSFYEYHRNTTPNINKFFSNGYYFTNAFAPASLTYTDSISFFYSISTNVHRVFERYNKAKTELVFKNNISFPNLLAQNGYKTAAFVSDEDYSYDRGVGRTFQYYFDRSQYPYHNIVYRPFTYSIGTKQLVPVVNKWLDENKNNKFFLFLQAYDVHCPFAPLGKFAELYQSHHSETIPFTSECFANQEAPQVDKNKNLTLKSYFSYMGGQEKTYKFSPQDQDYLISRYDAEINQTDEQLNLLFEKIKSLKLDNKTIIILMADHGDNVGDNGYFMKMSYTTQGNLQRNNLGIPLIIKTPNTNQIHKQEQIVQTIDIAPTILELIGLKPALTMQGKSFLTILGTKTEHNDFAYAYSVRYYIQKLGQPIKTYYTLESLIGKDWKLDSSIETDFVSHKNSDAKYYLYDLKKDPKEKTNLASKMPGKVKELINVLNIKRNTYNPR